MPDITDINGVAVASLGDFNGVAKASITDINGVTLVSAVNLLLDTYTGAAAAYSVRKLDKDYTGYCMRIVVDSAATVGTLDSSDPEFDIGFDSNGDLDTAEIVTRCNNPSGTNYNAYVTKWYDQSGNGKDAVQTTHANMPQIASSGAVITDNGKPALYPDGSGYFTSNFTISDGFTATLVFNHNSEGSQYMLGSASNVLKPAFYFAGTALRLFAGSYANIGTRSTSQALYSGIYDAAGSGNIVGRVNQTESVSATASAYTPGTSMQILASNTGGVAKHTVQEVIIWPSNQRSAGNISYIETDINNYYSIY